MELGESARTVFIMNPYQNLSFSQSDFSYNANGSGCVQNMSNVVYHVPPSVTKTCDFNCVCCLRLKVGQDPPCSISKVSVGTQTMLETPQGLDPSGFWTRGTYEHTVLQVMLIHLMHTNTKCVCVGRGGGGDNF